LASVSTKLVALLRLLPNRPLTPEISARGEGTWTSTRSSKARTVFLPVNVPGGLLYFGDAHAAQGDGELSGNGLETSMDVEVRVDLLPGSIPAPRLESSTRVMAMGLSSSLDDAIRKATTNMIEWLMAKYELTLPEVSQVLGTSAEYRVSVLVGKNTGMVIKLHKDRLRGLKRRD
jgi:amidase